MPDLSSLVDSLIGPLVAALLTIMVLSYLVGDNPLFRIATHAFIGVAAGYAGALALRNVLWPALAVPLQSAGLTGLTNGQLISTVLIPLLLVVLLFFKVTRATARLGTLPVALLVGVGAAVVVGGAITGTLLPQSLAAMNTLNPSAITPQTGETGIERVVNMLILLAGTVSTLAYFRFTVREPEAGASGSSLAMLRPDRLLALAGRLFIALTFGVMYAGALAATLAVLSERVQFLRDVFLAMWAGR